MMDLWQQGHFDVDRLTARDEVSLLVVFFDLWKTDLQEAL